MPSIAILSACHTTAPDHPASATPATGEPISAAAFFSPGESRYLSQAGSSVGLRVLREQSEPGTWTVRRWLLSATGDSERLISQQRYIVTSEGLSLSEQFDYAERVEVVFEPPMLLIPGRMSPGDHQEQDLHMKVHPLGSRTRIRAQGPAKSSIEYLGQEPADSADAPPSSSLVRHSLAATLGAASVNNTTDQWLLPISTPSGPAWSLIAERRREQTRVLGVQTRDNREHWILAPSPSMP